MRLGLHVSSFTWSGGAPTLGRDLAAVARLADEGGFDRLSVMDHVWQIAHNGPPELPMLEAYTALGFLAAKTERIRLLTLVTGAVYRAPGLLAKAVTTLDVLSGGRAMLGIGAAWNEDEAAGLGLDFPPRSERFERLEEVIQIVLQMWGDGEGPYEGRHYALGRTLNSPQVLTRPHPPILVGGSGEQKTLRLVAKYADACNLFGADDPSRKLEVLRERCAEVGRDYDEIEKTVMMPVDPGPSGENVDSLLERLREFAPLGVSHVHGYVPGMRLMPSIGILGDRVIPVAAEL